MRARDETKPCGASVGATPLGTARPAGSRADVAPEASYETNAGPALPTSCRPASSATDWRACPSSRPKGLGQQCPLRRAKHEVPDRLSDGGNVGHVAVQGVV